MNFNEEKLSKLKRADDHFDERYGKSGTLSRVAFEERALNWYYSEILKDRRKELKLTQQQLAERVGKKREYIALLEKGETDMQISSFTILAQALGIRLNFSYT